MDLNIFLQTKNDFSIAEKRKKRDRFQRNQNN